MSIPGRLVNQWQWQPGQNNDCKIDIRCRGHGTYILRTNVPVQGAKLFWKFRGNSGLGTTFAGSGRPQPNIMVWHLDRNKAADSFQMQFYVASRQRVPQITCQLYCAPFGTPLPRAPGWQPEDISRHIH